LLLGAEDCLCLLSSDRSHQHDAVDEAATPLLLHQHLESIPQAAKWAISRSQCGDGRAAALRAIQAGTLQAVGDALLKGGFDMSAFVLEVPGEASN